MDNLFDDVCDEQEIELDIDLSPIYFSDDDMKKYKIMQEDIKVFPSLHKGIKSFEAAGYEFVSRDETGKPYWIGKYEGKTVFINLSDSYDIASRDGYTLIRKRTCVIDDENLIYRSRLINGIMFAYFEDKNFNTQYIRLYKAKDFSVKEELYANIKIHIFDIDNFMKSSFVFMNYDEEKEKYIFISPITSRMIKIHKDCLVNIENKKYCLKNSNGYYLIDIEKLLCKPINEEELTKYGISNFEAAEKGFKTYNYEIANMCYSKYCKLKELLSEEYTSDGCLVLDDLDISVERSKLLIEQIFENIGYIKYCERAGYSFWITKNLRDNYSLIVVNDSKVNEIERSWLERMILTALMYGVCQNKAGIITSLMLDYGDLWVSEPVDNIIYIVSNGELTSLNINSLEEKYVDEWHLRIRTYVNDESRVILNKCQDNEEKNEILIFDCDGKVLHNAKYDFILDEYVNFIRVSNQEINTDMLIDTLTGKILLSVVGGGFAIHRNRDTDEIVIETIINFYEEKGHCYRYIVGNVYPMSRELEVFPKLFSDKKTRYIDERDGYAESAYFDLIYRDFDLNIMYRKDRVVSENYKKLFSWKK